MENDIFSGLEVLGFDKLKNVHIFEEEEKEIHKKKEHKHRNITIFDKTITCPICRTEFKARSVKSGVARTLSQDSDLFIRYDIVNPYFYDVWICPKCGYAALKHDFLKLKSYQIKPILMKITTKWKGRTYPETYDEKIAIERYKLALLNAAVSDSKSSTKAFICLKIAWMYRLLENEKDELKFLNNALEGYLLAYSKESFPIYGLQKPAVSYLIGELYRRTGDYTNSRKWFGNLLVERGASQKIKEKARDMVDLIKEDEKKKEKEE